MLQKLSFLILNLLFFTWAAAQSSNSWTVVSETNERASSPAEFILLQQKYPDVFGSYNPQTVRSANILHRTLVFDGETLCKPNDPRLTFVSRAYGLCEYSDSQESGVCFQTAPDHPSPFDPCMN